jgi:hypothetical protein
MTINYNLTKLIDNSTDVSSLAMNINQFSDGILFQLLIIGIFMIILLAMSRYGIDYAFATASFLCFILASFLMLAKLIVIIYPIGFLMMTVLAALWLYSTQGR